MKHIPTFEEFLNESNKSIDFSKLKRGTAIKISTDVSNRPLGGYATFWEYANGRVGYKTHGSSVTYVSPEYVTLK